MTALPTVDAVGATFAALDLNAVSWAVLRGADRPNRAGGDIDLLVSPRHADAFAAAVKECGYVEVQRPGHGTHRFFVRYDSSDDRWIELDVVTRIAFGRHQELFAAEADVVLGRRRRSADHWRLEPCDAFWSLLLHYALDLAPLDQAKRDELAAHATAAGIEGPVAAALAARLPPSMSLPELRIAAAARDVDGLDDAMQSVRQQWRHDDRIAAFARATADRLRARASRVRREASERGLVVAVLGPDGAGKSTLVAGLRQAVPLPTRSFYLGVLRTTTVARRLRRVPGLMLATRLMTFGGRSAIARYHASRGRLVLFDRYSYDALLPVARTQLRSRVSSALILRICPAPDLTMVLDVPPAVMFARKGELGEARLEDFRHRYLAMVHSISGAAVVDGSRSAEEVRAAATALIWQAFATRAA